MPTRDGVGDVLCAVYSSRPRRASRPSCRSLQIKFQRPVVSRFPLLLQILRDCLMCFRRGTDAFSRKATGSIHATTEWRVRQGRARSAEEKTGQNKYYSARVSISTGATGELLSLQPVTTQCGTVSPILDIRLPTWTRRPKRSKLPRDRHPTACDDNGYSAAVNPLGGYWQPNCIRR